MNYDGDRDVKDSTMLMRQAAEEVCMNEQPLCSGVWAAPPPVYRMK